jgi:hypothetical protein
MPIARFIIGGHGRMVSDGRRQPCRFVAALAIAIAALLAGCAVQETPQQRAARIEPMLAAAGFQMLPADTPSRVAETQRLTQLKVRYFIDNGKPRYWFNDPVNCHCVYVGGEKNYQQYEQIRLSQQAAQQEAQAAEMNEEAAQQEQMNMMLWPGPFMVY